jgi:predicted short-subunit dehydrogenase-like oxidoreductase (DUF2520 family)
MIRDVVILGAGRLAGHLGIALKNAGLNVHTVYNRHRAAANELASALNAQAVSDWKKIPDRKDLYILAVNDTAIAEVAGQLSRQIGRNHRVVHVSGATPAAILSPYFAFYGVFYPFQTFSSGTTVDFGDIPLCIWASEIPFWEDLLALGRQLSEHIYRLEDDQREVLHLAGVFANNFVNALYGMAFEILREKDVSPDILLPLIRQTAQKVSRQHPHQAQTGPAVRGDEETIHRHLKLLERKPSFETIYQLISEYIIRNRQP